MQAYVLGIVYCEDKNGFLFIKKNRPDWQEGSLNFPGGKIEDGESIPEALTRKFKEETNLDIPPDEWASVGFIFREDDFECNIGLSYLEDSSSLKQLTDEELFILEIAEVYLGKAGMSKYTFISNVSTILDFIHTPDYLEHNASLILEYPIKNS